MTKEALKLALEALERGETELRWQAITAIKEALAQRKPLTDEEISSLWDGHTVPVFGEIGINPIVFARAIEAVHGIKE